MMKSKHNYGILILLIIGIILMGGCETEESIVEMSEEQLEEAPTITQPSETPQTTLPETQTRADEESIVEMSEEQLEEAPTITQPSETPETQTPADLGDFKLVYDTISTAEHEYYEQILRESGLFEEVVNGLNDIIVLPFDVSVVFGECGTPNAFYDPTSKQIAMCHELIDEIASDLTEVAGITEEEFGLGIVHTLLFIFYHELGHALIDIYDLPITGREEDAVDQLSTVILVEAGEEGEVAVLDGASWFLLRAVKTDLDESAFADEHAFDAQRFYNLACWVYGKNPQTYSYLVEEEWLPEGRAARCEDEYYKTSNSWNNLLSSYLK